MRQQNTQIALKKQLGYTIDQTILIVSVIAILVTMIIGSVGWDLLSRAGGTKLQSHLTQMEQAAGSFFAQYGLWPTDVTGPPTGPSTDAMKALIDPNTSFTNGFDPDEDEFRNYLNSYSIDGSTVKHPFGAGGDVSIEPKTENGQTTLVFELTNVPTREFNNADEGIDGKLDTDKGRIRTDDDPDTTDSVTLQYYANVIR